MLVGNHLWVANVASSSLSKFDVSGRSHVHLLCHFSDGFMTPESVALSGDFVFVANMLGHGVGVHHIGSGELQEPTALEVIGDNLFVADAQKQDVIKFSLKTMKMVEIIR